MLIAIFSLHRQLDENQILWKHCLLILCCFVLLFALRNVILLLLLPACTGWYISTKVQRYQWWIFGAIYLIGLLFFFLSANLTPAFNFPQYIVAKQAEFNVLSGSSKLVLPVLQDTFRSFVHFFPFALDIAFVRPKIGDASNLSYAAAAIENLLIIFIIIIWMIFHQPLTSVQPIMVFFIFFSLSVLMLCGYTVSFSGAVVRYKSIVTPMLVTILLVTISQKGKRIYKSYKKSSFIIFLVLIKPFLILLSTTAIISTNS